MKNGFTSIYDMPQITISWIASSIIRFGKNLFYIMKICFDLFANIFCYWQCLCQVLVAFLLKGKLNIFMKIVIFFHISNINMLAHSVFTKIILLRLSKSSWEDFLQPVFYPKYIFITWVFQCVCFCFILLTISNYMLKVKSHIFIIIYYIQ